MTLLLATCALFPDGDEDAPALMSALEKHGVDARWAVWDDPSVDWTTGPVVLRSTWDYTLHREDFARWMHRVPDLYNRPEIVAWNSDKVYLGELQDAEVPVTRTRVIPPGPFELTFTQPDPPNTVVIKPSVGAGSRGAGRFRTDEPDAIAAHIDELHQAGRTALLQPYLHGVDDEGETALVFLGGRFSHAIRKGPMLRAGSAHPLTEPGGLFIEENISPSTAGAAQQAVAKQALAYVVRRFGSTPPYARVDLLPGPDGPVVVELELVEPSLFLSHGDRAADHFAAVLADVVAGRRTRRRR